VTIISAKRSTATGRVTFSEGTIKLGSFLLRGGKFSFRTSALPVGHYAIEASFVPNSALLQGSSTSQFVTVLGPKPKQKKG
jgi:hypothetical protein